MAVIAGSRDRPVQKRATRKDGWTKETRARFLDELTATCNIRHSAAAVGMTDGTARALRRRDPVFAGLWHDALRQGYDRLEMELVARAIAAIADDDNPSEADRKPVERAIDVPTAIKILQLRNGMAQSTKRGTVRPRASDAEIDAALLRKLTAVEKRLKQSA